MRSPSTKVFFTLGLLLGVLAGAAGGFYLAARFQGALIAAMMTDHLLIEAQANLRNARALAPGDSPALRESIGLALVTDLPFLQASCRNRDSIGRQGACSLLQEQAHYLREHPWSSGTASFDAMIQDILAHADDDAAKADLSHSDTSP